MPNARPEQDCSIQRALVEVNRKNIAVGKPALNARIRDRLGPVVIDAAGEIYGDAPERRGAGAVAGGAGTVVVTAKSSIRSAACSSSRTAESTTQRRACARDTVPARSS